MKIVIDIPEGMLDELNTCKFPIQDAYRLCSIIENGQPLPKGHGRLIDADALARFIDYGHLNSLDAKVFSENDIRDLIDNAPTIIEADKEGAKNDI